MSQNSYTNKCECWYLISKINCIIHVSCHRKAPLFHYCYIQLNIILDSWLLRMDEKKIFVVFCKKGFCDSQHKNGGDGVAKICSCIYTHGFDGQSKIILHLKSINERQIFVSFCNFRVVFHPFSFNFKLLSLNVGFSLSY